MPTADEIADALAGTTTPVVIRARLEERTSTFGLIRDLSTALERATIEVDNDEPVVWRADLVMLPENLPADFDTATALVSIGLDVLVEGAFERFPLGLYGLTRPRRTLLPGGVERWEVAANGIGIRLIDQTTLAPFTVASGTNYVTAMESILDGLSLRHNIPAVPSNTPSDFTWGPGVQWREILDSLASGINRYPLSPDARGVFTTTEQIDPSTETPDVSYSTEIEPRMVAAPFTPDEDVGRFSNDIVVLVDDPARAAFFERRQNTDPTSIIGIPRTGRDVLDRIVGDRILDQATAGTIADFLVRDAAAKAEAATLRTLLDPRRGPRETYLVRIDTREVDTLWRVTGWRATLSPGAVMEHRITRARSIIVTEP